MSARALVSEAAARLRAAGCDSAVPEAEWLLAHLLGLTPMDMAVRDQPVGPDVAARLFSQVESRIGGTPLQYLLGFEDFFGARFDVGPGVFVPRPETEVVAEQALKAFSRLGPGPLRLVDAGTGSGCLAITLARRLPACVVVGIELSWRPLWTARENARRQGVANRVHLVRGQWLKPIRGPVDGIVSNPPYIPSAELDELPPDVRRQPVESLDGGLDGLRDARALLAQTPGVLRPGGCLVMECAEDQVAPLLDLVRSFPWVERGEGFEDLARRPRGIIVTRRD